MSKGKVKIAENVIIAAVNGDEHAFEEIVLQYERPIFSFVFKMVNNFDATLDITQEVFIKLYAKIHTYDKTKNFGSWIFTIAKTTTYDYLRKIKRKKELYILDGKENFYDVVDERQQSAEKIEKKIDVYHTLNKIKPQNKKILLLYFWSEYRYKDIAEIFGITVNGVKSKIRRAKNEFREQYLLHRDN